MTNTYYNPDQAQDRETWMALSPADKVRVAKNYHDSIRVKASKQHAYLHVFVEDQIAHGVRPVVWAMERLQRKGMQRHEAIHAVAAVCAAHWQRMSLSSIENDQSAIQLRLNAELDALPADDSSKPVAR
ncbi:hypothetical protein [Undibacterium sp. Tian12W]|uniref:hypothetical protein n=1 Tax=Undibacterium sp. Tian12W TaxID=3413054 RepID=UPI003BF07F59